MKFKYYSIALLLIVSLAFRCGVNDPEPVSGSLQITIVKAASKSALVNVNQSLTTLHCTVKKGSETKFDADLTKNASGNFYAEIKELVEGCDYSVSLLGKNANGVTILTGEKSNICVEPGEAKKVPVPITHVVFTLDVSVSPPGSGNVTKNPDKTQYNDDEVVALTAVPDSSYRFDHWEADLSGSINPDSITMNGNKSVTAYFIEVSETVSTPSTPSGPTSGTVGQSLSFSTGGSTSNLGHSVEYRYDWGDGSNFSTWGDSTQSHSYSGIGTYSVKAQARCQTHTNVESSWSPGLPVTISGVPNLDEIIDITIDDDNNGNSSGNGDGIVQVGEVIKLILKVKNNGNRQAHSVSGILTITSGDASSVNIQDDSEVWPDIPAGASDWNSADFDFIVTGMPPGNDLDFTVTMTYDDGNRNQKNTPIDFSITVYPQSCDNYEPNNTAGQATNVGAISTTPIIRDACIDPVGDIDYYSFSGIAGQFVEILTQNTGSSQLDGKIWLYDSNGTLLVDNDDDGSTSQSRVEHTIETNGTYYIRYAYYSNSGSFPNSAWSAKEQTKNTSQKQTSATTGDYRLNVSIRALTQVWQDGFESYQPGSFPSSTWTPDANASQSYTDNGVAYEGSKSLRLIGVIGGCWGALAYRPLTISPPYEIELVVGNGNETLSGCHPDRAYIGLRKGFTWSNPSRVFILFKGNGEIISASGASLGTYSILTWYKVRIRYERPSSSEVQISYWVDNTYLGSETLQAHAEEDQMTNLDLTVQEGTVWFDAVKVFQ